MLTVLGNPKRFCDGITRRTALKAGSLGLLGGFFGLPAFAEASAPVGRRAGRAKSVIFIFLHGGAATQDMYDLKPNAPAEIRGEFRPIATNVPGIQICEHLPKTSRWLHRSALVRSINHRAGCHNVVPTFTGFSESVPEQNIANPNHPPSMGSVCEYLRQARRGEDRDAMPAYVCVPNYLGWGESGRRPGIYGGFLGQRYDPLCSECNAHFEPGVMIRDRGRPAILRGQPTVPHGVLPEGMTLDRLNRRQTLIEQVEREAHRLDAQHNIGQFGRTRERAFNILTSRKLREAFNLEAEEPRLRDLYGPSLFGSSLLTARKLVEAGVQFINVFWDNYAPRFQSQDFGWDTHEVNFITLRECYLPWLDRSYSALMEDLDTHGLLDETLVVTISDFGRTPGVNRQAGRDHWSQCYTVMLAGAGIRGGTVYGASDAHAAFVYENPVSPADICATIYECLGIDPDTIIYDRAHRPVTICQGGRAIRDILTA